MATPQILVVDDEPDLVELICLTLSRMQLATQSAGDVAGAKQLLKSQRFDLCLTDMRLPDGDGLELLEWLATNNPGLPCAVITAHGNVESAVRALKLGAFDFVSKPLDLGVLRKLVASAIKLAANDDDPGATLRRGPMLIGRGPAMERLREMIQKVARSQAPVHIFGESGTGKELVARMIHTASSRADEPFVAVNCGAIPNELMESELFGHKRGSFTGAVADKPGLIASAEGGTLFLDEVADLPLHMQVKLLRVIQEKTVRPVGEAREQSIDVRILSATHKDLAELVRLGRFREDLYYRINVIDLRVPPLRERREDIPDLIETIVRRLSRRLGVEPAKVSAAALQALGGYAFPGNVRELENTLERALALCTDGTIEASDLQLRPSPLAGAATASPGATSSGTNAPASGGNHALGDQLEEVERAAIIKALEQTRYNKTAAAKLLGMTFRALRYRIQKLGIE
ncbi:MAG TPA: sigma-54 dependent transcriptional regulator [Steroidobacteraceae bacterium]|nr:sigma-54 dependent transcriptional regulator [Steroidobacteraceae bacterium]HRX89485.1 sigma-54 dependent transcriptional regulator [Steroidobacteraceae bacterium]